MSDGVECFECSSITEGEDLVAGDPCDSCDSDNTEVVTISACPEEDPSSCKDENHHWGRGDHVVSKR
jgi:hypothetical protein